MKLLDVEVLTREEYDRLAYEYMAGLPLEHFAELPETAHQREITTMSFALISRARPEVKLHNELLVQYPKDEGVTGFVVPDAMVIVQEQPIGSGISFQTAYEPTSVLMVLEYVSQGASNQRKDYIRNRKLYGSDLKIAYYFLFDPILKRLTLLRLYGWEYEEMEPNGRGRYPIEELDVELAIVDGWVRFWFEGKLVPLPGELMTAFEESEAKGQRESRRADREKKRADVGEQRAEQEKQRAEQEKHRADFEAVKSARLMAKLRSLGVELDD